jgi:hypothetical protein
VFLEIDDHKGRYEDYIASCEKHGIKEARLEVDKMIGFDYLIRNTDRNMGNYGVLRDSETLEWKGLAPLFDHGGSLWHSRNGVEYINNSGKSKCRSFLGTNEENLGLLKDVDWYDVQKAYGAAGYMAGTFEKNENLKKERIERVVSCFEKRAVDFVEKVHEAGG